jgi:hypothetical protein
LIFIAVQEKEPIKVKEKKRKEKKRIYKRITNLPKKKRQMNYQGS